MASALSSTEDPRTFVTPTGASPVSHTPSSDHGLDALVGELISGSHGEIASLLGSLVGYWGRERLADIAPKFAMLRGGPGALGDNPDALSGLVFSHFETRPGARSRRAVFRFPPQKVGKDLAGAKAAVWAANPDQQGWGVLAGIDLANRMVSLVWSSAHADAGVHPRALVADDWVNPAPKPDVLVEFGYRVLDGEPLPAVVDALLNRALPCFVPGGGPPDGVFVDDLDALCAWACDLNHSYIAIQGPPGTGKTYRGAHVIHALIRAGKRVGVTALSHAAADNLLRATWEVFAAKGELGTLRAAKKGSKEKRPVDGYLEGVDYVDSNAGVAAGSYNLVVGTTWLFASKAMREAPVDVLVIDEAGQLALADGVAAAGSATNLVLLGDPLQLAQVSQAHHPKGAGNSVLGHVLGDTATLPAHRGVFLAETRRMHPSVCAFISQTFYEGRLTSHPSCALQRLEPGGAGLRWIEAHHEGRSTESPEEATLVAATVRELLGTPWVGIDGETRVLGPEDFLVVAPYNDQVDLLKSILGVDVDTACVPVGTVDKFQGREAPVTFFTMTTSSEEDAPRGVGFLFSPHRLNVAVSRARCISYLVCTKALLASEGRSPDDQRLITIVNSFMDHINVP